MLTPMSHSLSPSKRPDVGDVGVDTDQLPPWQDGQINLRGLFEPTRRALPLELEIGSGKGSFLVREAAARSNVNFVGLEYAKAFWRHAADRCRRHGLSNVRLIHIEAGLFLRHFAANEIFDQVHIYFPDPWPKKRHHKRRLIESTTLQQLHRVLAVNGCVRLATDHTDYFEWMLAAVQQTAELFERLPFESPISAQNGEQVGTNFERKYRREGRPFHGLILRKR